MDLTPELHDTALNDNETMSKSKSLSQPPNKNDTFSSTTPLSALCGCTIIRKAIKRRDMELLNSYDTSRAASIRSRIENYEGKYLICMESQTQLSLWIKSTKEKGLPSPLTEGYTPPFRSRLPDFILSSLSTRYNRKNQYNNSCETPVIKSSLSTLIKRATESISTSYNKQPSSRQQKMPTNEESNTNNHRRFTLTSSLNRFSLPKSSYSSIAEKYQSGNNLKDEKSKEVNKRHRFSTPPPMATMQHHQEQRNSSCSPTTKSSVSLHDKVKRPHSTILPHSPSSIFLDKLRSRAPGTDLMGKKQCLEPNISIKTIVTDYLDDDNMTPPSSRSSTESKCTPPYYRHMQQQDLFPPKSANHKLSSIAAGLATIPQAEEKDVVYEEYKPLNVHQKKKRVSLLVTPSLSAIRLISHKSQFLRHQSMLA